MKGKKANGNTAATEAVDENTTPVVESVSEQKVDISAAIYSNHPVRSIVSEAGEPTNDLSQIVTSAGSGGTSVDTGESVAGNPGSGVNLASGDNAAQFVDNKYVTKMSQYARKRDTREFEGFDDQTYNGDYVANVALSTDPELKKVAPGSIPAYGQIYDRKIASVSVDKVIFTSGQFDDASMALDAYPTTDALNEDDPEQFEPEQLQMGNYLLKALKVTIADGEVSNVEFETEEITCDTDATVIGFMPVTARERMDQSENSLKEWKKGFYEPDTKKHVTPVITVDPQAAKKLMLARDVVASDGPIAELAVKGMLEPHAYATMLSKILGGNKAEAAIAGMLVGPTPNALQRITSFPTWTSYDIFGRKKNGNDDWEVDAPNELSTVAIINLFSSGIREGDTSLKSLMLQQGMKEALSSAAQAFDKFDFKIDKNIKAFINKTFGWYQDSEADAIVGANRFGLVLPYNPAKLFKFRAVNGGTVKELDSTVHGDANYAQNWTQYGAVMSPLFYNLVEFLKDDFMKAIASKVNRGSSVLSTGYDDVFTIPFEFSTSKITPMAALICLSLKKYAENTDYDYLNGMYTEFKLQHQIDPLEANFIDKLTLADVVSTASFRGLNSDPVLTEASAPLKTMLSDPEFINLSASVKSGTLSGTMVGQIVMHDLIGEISDDYDLRTRWNMLIPLMLKTTMAVPALKRIMGMTPAQMKATGDKPIAPYNFTGTGKAKIRGKASIKQVAPIAAGGGAKLLNAIGFDGSTFSVTASDNVSKVSLTRSGILTPRRASGMFAPAPTDMLSGMGHDSVLSSVVAYIQGGCDVAVGAGYVHKIKLVASPLESYHITYLMDPTDLSNFGKGSALYADMLMIETGKMSKTDLTTLCNSYGIYLDPAAGYVMPSQALTTCADEDAVVDHYEWDSAENEATWEAMPSSTPEEIAAKAAYKEAHMNVPVYAGVTDTISVPQDLAVALWNLNYGYPFVHTPFEGMMDSGWVKDTDGSDNFNHVQDDFTSLNTLAAMSGLKGQLILDFSKEADKDHARLQDADSMVDDYAFVARDNLWF